MNNAFVNANYSHLENSRANGISHFDGHRQDTQPSCGIRVRREDLLSFSLSFTLNLPYTFLSLVPEPFSREFSRVRRRIRR